MMMAQFLTIGVYGTTMIITTTTIEKMLIHLVCESYMKNKDFVRWIQSKKKKKISTGNTCVYARALCEYEH